MIEIWIAIGSVILFTAVFGKYIYLNLRDLLKDLNKASKEM